MQQDMRIADGSACATDTMIWAQMMLLHRATVSAPAAPSCHILLPACRNVTVTGAQGLDTVLDLAFLHGVVQLCATCILTFRNITLTNDRLGECIGMRLRVTPRASAAAAALEATVQTPKPVAC
jgi:hypothetical protein